jgi:hypothetical protein
MDYMNDSSFQDLNLLFITPCKDFSLPDLSKTTRNTPGVRGVDTISSIKFFPTARMLWSSDINEPFESDLKPMSPNHLANKKISSSPWANRDLQKELISNKPIYSNERFDKNGRSETKAQETIHIAVGANHEQIQLINRPFPRLHPEHVKLPEIVINEPPRPIQDKSNKIWTVNHSTPIHGSKLLQKIEINSNLNSAHKNPTKEPYHSANITHSIRDGQHMLSKNSLQVPHSQVFVNRTSQILHQMNSQKTENYPTSISQSDKMLLELGNATNPVSYTMAQRKRQNTTTTSPVNLRQTSKRMLARGTDSSNCGSSLGNTQSMKPSMDKETPMKDLEFDEEKLDDDAFNEIKKRRRKSNIQLRILKNELDNDENWSKEKIFKVSKMTGLSESQVYKWCWDQKKKKDDNECKKNKGHNTPTSSHNRSSLLRDSETSSEEQFKQSSAKQVFGSSEVPDLQKARSVNYPKNSLNGNGGGIYADFFDDEEKENFDIENLTFKNKAISKLSIGNSISHQKFGVTCGSLHDLKRDSLVYKQGSLG